MFILTDHQGTVLGVTSRLGDAQALSTDESPLIISEIKPAHSDNNTAQDNNRKA